MPTSMCVLKKRQARPCLIGAVGSSSPLFSIRDANSGRTCLIDTGAAVTIWPKSRTDTVSNEVHLAAANGTRINTYGRKTMRLKLGQQNFVWEVIIADVKQPLIGADFLRENQLIVDLQNRKLLDTKTFYGVNLVECHASPRPILVTHRHQDERNAFQNIVKHYPGLSNPDFHSVSVKHGVQHYIETTAPPIRSRARRLTSEKQKVAKDIFDNMLRLGICRRSNSS